MIIYFLSLLFPFSAHATCTPAPDCTSIGYTETSCEGDSLKCPFDISKMKCMPCDSSFRYDCSGKNVTRGTGSVCNNKYITCECVAGATFSNGSCTCNTSCTEGNIYYSDGTCSSCVDSSKTPIGIIVKDNELVMSKRKSSVIWWSSEFIETSLTNYNSSDDVINDFNGKSNTAVIVAAYPTETVDNNAAIYCNSYSTEGTNAGDWYLPAAGELYSYVYSNYSTINTTTTTLGWTLGNGYYWSSSELCYTHAWYIHLNNGSVKNYGKRDNHSVTCFLEIN